MYFFVFIYTESCSNSTLNEKYIQMNETDSATIALTQSS